MADSSSEETEPLIKTADIRNTTTCSRKTVVVEPLTFLVVVAYASYVFVSNLYVYQHVGEAHGFDWLEESQSGVSSCEKNNSQAFIGKMEVIQREASAIVVILQVALGLPSIPATIMIMSLSDKMGRKMALLVPVVGVCVYLATFLFVVLLKLSVYFLLFGAVVCALTGGLVTIIQGSFAYLADTVPAENLGLRMVILEMCLGLGGIVPVLGMGYFVRSAGFLAPFGFAFGISVLALLYVIFLVPETVPRDPDSRVFTCRHFIEPLQLCFGREGRSGGKLIIPLIIFIVISFGDSSSLSLNQLYAINKPLCWNSVKLGYWSAVSLVIVFVGAVGLLKVLNKCGIEDRTVLVLGVADFVLKFTLMSLATRTWIMYAVPVVGMLSNVPGALTRSLMSKTVDSSKRGALFGCLSAVQATALLVGTVVVMGLYSATVSVWPGLAYAVIAALAVPVLFLAILYCERYARFVVTVEQ